MPVLLKLFLNGPVTFFTLYRFSRTLWYVEMVKVSLEVEEYGFEL